MGKSNEGGSYLNSRVSCVSKSNHSILCIRIYVYIYICITWLVEPPLKNLLAKLDHPVLKFPSLISVAMHIISPQQPPLQSSSSQAFCKRMCLIVRLRIRNHLKGKKTQEKWTVAKKLKMCKEKGHGIIRESKHLQITKHSLARFHVVIFQRGCWH